MIFLFFFPRRKLRNCLSRYLDRVVTFYRDKCGLVRLELRWRNLSLQ